MPKRTKRRYVLELRRKPMKRRKRTTMKRKSRNKQGLTLKGVL